MLPVSTTSRVVNVISQQDYPNIHYFLVVYSFKQQRISAPMPTASGSRAFPIDEVQRSALTASRATRPQNGATTVLGCRSMSCALSPTASATSGKIYFLFFSFLRAPVMFARSLSVACTALGGSTIHTFYKGILLF